MKNKIAACCCSNIIQPRFIKLLVKNAGCNILKNFKKGAVILTIPAPYTKTLKPSLHRIFNTLIRYPENFHQCNGG